MAKTRFMRYIEEKRDIEPIVSDREIRISADIDGDPLVWCADPAGDNPEVVIDAKRGKILSITVDGRRVA